ncbi:MAG: hypothetical protein ACK5SL_07835 [Cyclobacteriaceae bacterium]
MLLLPQIRCGCNFYSQKYSLCGHAETALLYQILRQSQGNLLNQKQKRSRYPDQHRSAAGRVNGQ